MRGHDKQQADMFSYLSPEARVRKDHPLRAIRVMADQALENMSRRFDGMYARTGRPSIPPEKLLRAQLIQMLYSVRSERLLMEEIDYSVLFRWFVGMNLDEPVWDVTVFTKNRDRLLDGDVAREFLCQVVKQAQEENLTSDEHFTVDGTLIEAWASLKSFQRKEQKDRPPDDPGNPSVDFHGEQRSNETHESTSDPDALLARKGTGKEAKLSYNGNLLVENRNGLIVTTELFQANGTAERDAALGCWSRFRAAIARRWEPTRRTIRRASWRSAGIWKLRHMWHRTSRGAVEARSMRGPRGTAVMRSARRNESGSKKASDG